MRSKKCLWRLISKFLNKDEPQSDDIDEVEKLKNQLNM